MADILLLTLVILSVAVAAVAAGLAVVVWLRGR
jgi:hypothetical protein